MDLEQNTRAPLASPGHRLGALAVDAGLSIVTFGIGWFVWSLILWSKGQTPGKYLLKIRVLNEPTGTPATWGQMLIRQILFINALGIPFFVAYGIFLPKYTASETGISGLFGLIACGVLYLAISIVDIVWIFGPTHRRLIDYWSGTINVNEAKVLPL